MRINKFALSTCVLATTLTGCASLPSSGPTARQLLAGEKAQAAALNFTVVDLTADTLPAADPSNEASAAALASLARTGRVDLIGAGDVLDISIFEVGTTLFGSSGQSLASATASDSAPAASFDPSARRQAIAGISVTKDGSIRLPYIGRLIVAGRTTDEVEAMIERGLRGKSQMPQAVVSIRSNVSNTVLVSGAVAHPGRQPLTLGRERLLDAIAAAGGAGVDAPQTTLVRFARGDRTVEAFLASIASGSTADLVLIPGDRIDLVRQTQSFTVFGATAHVSQIQFETMRVSLDEAIARAGGPDDNRADPSAVFVFRNNGATGGPLRIYRLNMLKPSSYFLAQRFMMHDKDVLYIANARINQTRKLVEIINLLFSPFFNARAVAN